MVVNYLRLSQFPSYKFQNLYTLESGWCPVKEILYSKQGMNQLCHGIFWKFAEHSTSFKFLFLYWNNCIICKFLLSNTSRFLIHDLLIHAVNTNQMQHQNDVFWVHDHDQAWLFLFLLFWDVNDVKFGNEDEC